jgi:fucose permease
MKARAQSVLLPLGIFVVIGLPAGSLGVAWPHMRTSFGAPLAGLGLLLTLATIGFLLSTAWTGALSDRLGLPALVGVMSAIAALGLLLLAVASQWWMALLAALMIGMGSGPSDAALNAFVAIHHGVRLLGWLHASWALGAALGPQVIVAAETVLGSWRPAYLLMAAAFAGTALLVIWQRTWFAPDPSAPSIAVDGREPTKRRFGDHAGVVALLASLFFLYVGVETATGQWPYSELTAARGVSGATAGLGVSLYWSGLAGGRVALGVFGNRIGVRGLLDICVGTTAIGAVGFWLAPPLIATLVTLPLIGLALAPIFPLFTVVTRELIGARGTTHAIGYQTAIGIAGGALVPAAIGLLLQSLGPLTLGPALSVIACGFATAHLVSRRFLRTPTV